MKLANTKKNQYDYRSENRIYRGGHADGHLVGKILTAAYMPAGSAFAPPLAAPGTADHAGAPMLAAATSWLCLCGDTSSRS